MSTTPARALVSDRVFRRLCEDVLSGRYLPGEKLPTQRRLAADLGVNIASVREAVKRLEQLRLVEVRHGDAMRVADWRAEGGLDVLVHTLMGAGALDRGTLAAIMEARTGLLAEVARLAALNRSGEHSSRLVELAGRFAEAPDRGAAQAIDLAFFSEAIAASGNLVFVLVMNSIRRLYLEQAELFTALVAQPEELAPLYRRAARAIAAGNAEAAARAVRQLAGTQQRWLANAADVPPAPSG